MKDIKAAIVVLLLPAILYAHAGGRDIKGTIVKFDHSTLEMKRVDGHSEIVPLAASTTYRVGDALGRWEDMRIGSRVVVHLGHDGKAVEVHLPGKK